MALCYALNAVAQNAELPELDLQYVPSNQLEAVLRGDQPGVQLSASEFQELLQRAADETQRRQGAPLTVTLKGVAVDASIQEDELRAGMIVSAESFVDGWTSVDLPLALWSLHSARELGADEAEQPAAISRRADNPAVVTWMLRGSGEHRLRLDLTATLMAAGNDTVVNVGLPSAPTGTFSMHLPARRFVELNGERLERPGDIEAESIVPIPLGQRTELPLRFTDRIAVNLAESLTLATTTVSVGVSTSQVLWTAATDLSVFGTGVDRLECVIPSSLEITQVSAEGLQAWELSDAAAEGAAAPEGAPTRITLQFRQPIQGSRRIMFQGVLGVATDAAQGWQVPTLTIDGVSSHVGYVAIDVATGLRLKTLQVGELRTIEPAEFPQAVDPAHTHLFQFWNQEFQLILATLPREREVHVAMTNIVDIGNEGLSLVSAIAVTPLFESMFDFEIVIPADWNVVSATVDGAAAHWQTIPRAAGEHVLRIPFTAPATPGTMRSIQINAYRLPEDWPIQDEARQISLPAVELPQADVVEAVYGVVCDPSLDVQTVGLDGLDPASQVEIDLMNARLAPYGKSLTLGFVYQNSHFTGDISLSRSPSQMFVDLTSLVELASDRALVHWRAAIEVEGGGVRRLEVSVPEEAGADVRFTLSPSAVSPDAANLGMPVIPGTEVPRIVQQTPSFPSQGRRVWTLELDRRLIGRAELTAVFQFPKPTESATDEAEAAPVDDTSIEDEIAAVTAAANDAAAGDDASDDDASDDETDDAAASEDEAATDDQDDATTDEPSEDDPAATDDAATESDDATDADSADATSTDATESDVQTPTVEEIKVTQELRSIFLLDAVRSSSIVAVVGREEQHLRVRAATTDGEELKLIDPIDVPIGDRAIRPRLVASYQSADPDWVMVLSEDRLPGEAIPTVVFDHLRLASLLGRAGEGQHQASAQIRAVGIQGLRFTLPERSDHLWSVVLDGRPIEVRQEPTAVFLPWPAASTADQIHVLEITWKTTGTEFAPLAMIDQVPPKFEAVTGAGGIVQVELIRQTWELMHPEEAMLVSNHGEFKPAEEFRVSSLLSRLPRELAWPTGGEMALTLGSLALLAVVVGLVALALRQQPVFEAQGQRTARWIGWAVGGVVVLLILFALILPTLKSANDANLAARSTFGAIPNGEAPSAMWQSDMSPVEDYYAEDAAEAYDGEAGMGGGGGFGGGQGGFGGAPGFSRRYNSGEAMPSPMAAEETPFAGVDDVFDSSSVASTPAVPGETGENGQPDPSSFEGNARSDGQPAIVGRDDWPDRTIAGLAQPNTFSGELDIPFRQGSFDLGAPPFGGLAQAGQGNSGGPSDPFGTQPQLEYRTPATGTPIGQPGQPHVSRDRGALLSLPIAMNVPPRTITTAFEYVGAQSDTSQTKLSVSYVDRQLGQVITWVCAAVVALLMWLLRRRPVPNRLALAIFVPAAVISLALVVPGTWHVALDGLFIGSLIGSGLWIVVAVADYACTKCHQRKETAPASTTSASQVTALLILGLSFLADSKAMADDLLPPTRVIVPYDSLEELEQEGVSRVIIPRDDFWRLYNAAHPELANVPPPAAALVTQADFTARLVTEGTTRVQVEGTFEILTLNQSSADGKPAPTPAVLDIPLPLGQAPINEALLGDEPANVILRDGVLVLLLPQPAVDDDSDDAARSRTLTLRFDLPAPGASSAKGEFTLPLLNPAAGEVTFELPRPSEELELFIGDGREAYQLVSTDAGEQLRISSALKPATRFSWQVREMRGNLESTVHADTGIAVVAGRQGLSVRHAFQVRVLQGTLSEIRMALPAEGRLQQIAGVDVVGWQYDQEGDTPELTVYFRSDIAQSTQLTVDLFQPFTVEDSTSIAVPLIELQGVSREAGMLAIYPQDDLTARAGNVSGLRQINLDQFTPLAMPQLPATAASQAFRFVGESDRSLELNLESRSLESVAHMQYGVRVGYRKLLVTAHARITPSASPRRSVLVELPDDFLLTSVAGPTVSDWFETRTAEGVRRLQLDLVAPQPGDVEIMLDGNLPRDVDEPTTDLLLPRVLDVEEYASQLSAWVDPAFEPSLLELGGWETLDRQELSPMLRSLDAAEPWLVFTSEEPTPEPVTVQLDRGVPRLRAASVTLIAVTETGVDYGFTFQWDVSQAAADTFVVRLPSWLAGAQFEVPGLRQIDRDIDGDVVEFRMQLVEPVTGRFLVSATASLPFPADGRVEAPIIDCRDAADPPAFDLAGQMHHAMVVNLSRSRIVPDPNATIETVGRDDVSIVLREELVQQAMAIARVREQGPAPVWNIATSNAQQTSSDLVQYAELTTLLEMDGTWRTQAVYTVRNRGHQYLAVELPAESRVLSVMVRGLPGRTYARDIGGQAMHLVPLPATSAADLSYQVTLTTEGRLAASLPELFDIAGDDLEIPLPVVVSKEKSAEFGLPVRDMLWTLHLPEEVTAETVTGAGSTNFTSLDRREFLEQSATLEISNFDAQCRSLAEIANDEQVSLAQRQQALSNLQELNRRISRFTIDGTPPASLSPELAGKQGELVMSNSAVIDQNYGLLQTDALQQSLSQQDIGRLFCASNGAQIVDDNRDTSIAAGTIGTSFGFATRGETATAQTEGRGGGGRAVLRGQAQNQGIDLEAGGALTDGLAAPGYIFLEVPPGSPHIPLGRPANLQSHTIRNLTDSQIPELPEDFMIDVRHGADAAFINLGESGTQGGLSLAMQLPLRGEQMSFSRVGGDGKLVLRFRPATTWNTGLGWLWLLVWGAALVWSLGHIRRHAGGVAAWSAAVLPMMVLGLLGFLLLAGPARWVGFVVLAVGCLAWAWQSRLSLRESRAG